ncbi:MAG: hypothetical protein ACFCUU_08305 [Cyclobacteriaceae bacterium]
MKSRRLFPLDKNYILMQAQDDARRSLLKDMVKLAKRQYEVLHNPLGLVDKAIMQIRNSNRYPVDPFVDFYHDLAVIYRYKFGEVQLEFLWDGRSHYQKYQDDWKFFFIQTITALSLNDSFLKIMLEISVFSDPGTRNHILKNRLRNILSSHFEIRVNKNKGIIPLRIQA